MRIRQRFWIALRPSGIKRVIPSELRLGAHVSAFVARMLPAFLLLLSVQPSRAGSATWRQTPVTNDWDTAANWTPETVPRGQFDVATFASSDTAEVNLSHATGVESIVFAPDADPFTITVPSDRSLVIKREGISNDSSQTQQFVVGGTLDFVGEETAGDDMAFTTLQGGSISFAGGATTGAATNFNIATESSVIFDQGASAANATFMINGAAGFFRQSTADNATFVVAGGQTTSAEGGVLSFADQARAGDAVITVEGGAVAGAMPGVAFFNIHGSAENATLIAEGGLAGGPGGFIHFHYYSRGTTGRVELLGNSVLAANNSAFNVAEVGSLEGTGTVLLDSGGGLRVGANNLSTTFSGLLQGPGAELLKIGTGTLTLTGANTYTYTVIKRGAVMANNSSGSATGSGSIEIVNGGLGGSGTVSGPVLVYAPRHGRTFLAPGATGQNSIGTLAVQSAVTFYANSTYNCEIDAARVAADQLVTGGATIDSGANIDLAIHRDQLLPVGTVFTVINNTAATPIAGAFANLADGAMVMVGSNNFQASYEGGDGNDLTLAVVP